MSELHMQATELDIDKFVWCAKIALHLEKYDWLFHEAYELAETLHYDYIELNGDYDSNPIEVLKEEMTYWAD